MTKQLEMTNNTNTKKPTMLLHSCCGPCSTSVLERVTKDFDVTVFFFNPNITDEEEYRLRLREEKRFIESFSEEKKLTIGFIEGEYNPEDFFNQSRGLEDEKEGGRRCRECFDLRLRACAKKAKELGFDFFDTTLSVSPHKNYDLICLVANSIAWEVGVKFAAGNYKKQDGFKRSIELSKEYKLYRQDYCGCIFSKKEAEERKALKAE